MEGIHEEVLGGALKPEGREACGVMGISLERGNASPLIYYGLMALQHRGQESCGISVYDGERVLCDGRAGMVDRAFGE
ncbi:MAG: amidophosphoribosyltransferase, partial [Candidatus Bathyarchaeia archaeon]